MKYICLLGSILIMLSSCKTTYKAKTYDFPKPVDTSTKEIVLQDKKVYRITSQGVYADNLFDGARLNDFESVGTDHFKATFSPENFPINASAYYAFRIWSDEDKEVTLELNYTKHQHRYHPKISHDGKNWELLDSNAIALSKDSVNAILNVALSKDTLWIAAQEVQNSSDVKKWIDQKEMHPDVHVSSIGKSRLNKDLWVMDIYQGDIKKKDIIIILGRQHPPEVTGYFAMQAFIDELLADHPLSNNFREKYRLLVLPLINPDGVDLGHWRHNEGGVDLNRDWAYYRQPENRQVADYIVREVNEQKSKVIFGLDFHSTFWDVYYTMRQLPKELPELKDYWLWSVSESLGEELHEKPSNIGGPVSKNWIFTQFGAMGITYEIGDSTPRPYIIEKGKVSARELMKLLIFKN